MPERKNPSETPFGKEWVMFGQHPGLKTEDLLAFEKTRPHDVQVLPGISIGASLFSDFVSGNNYSANTPDDLVEHGQMPETLVAINKQAVDLFLSNKPVVVRSSATDERGGSGIYDSTFFVPTGNQAEDLARLTEAEREVYRSYFREEGRLFRDGQFSQEGMGLLIHPVIGNQYGNHFMPAFSGVFTMINGEMVMKAVPGLGTKAVALNLDNIMRGEFNPYKTLELANFDAINLATGDVEPIKIDKYIRQRQHQQVNKLEMVYFAWKDSQRKGQTTYWEFAIGESFKRPFVVQSTLEPQPPLDLEFGTLEGKTLLEASDIANIGIRRGRGILVLFVDAHQVPVDIHDLIEFNKTHKNFLLGVPDISLSSQSEGLCQLAFPHFSNASGILELHYNTEINDQYGVDHEVVPGGSHFLELCRRKHILFLGVRADKCKPLLDYKSEKWGLASYYWDVDFKITNTRKKGRIEILDNSV